MRTIFREQPYEQPLAAGRYQYRREGQPTGSVESWRLTATGDGHHFMRVDLNADGGEGGDSVLFHLLLGPEWQPERLIFRHFRPGGVVAGNVLFEEGRALLAQTEAGQPAEAEVAWAADAVFWFPATAGLGLLAAHTPAGEFPAVTLHKGRRFRLVQTTVSVAPAAPETVEAMGRAWQARPVAVAWGDQERTVWLDESGWPVKMARADGLVAVETRRLVYRQPQRKG